MLVEFFEQFSGARLTVLNFHTVQQRAKCDVVMQDVVMNGLSEFVLAKSV